MLVIVLGGGLFAMTLTREMFPESQPDKLLVSTIYPGVQPEEIEKAVTIKIEEAVRDVDGIEKVDSTVREGASITVLTLRSEVKNPDVVLQEVKAEVDALQDLPDEVESTTIRKIQPKLPVIGIALYGENDEAALKRAARDLRDDLLRLPGVTEVEIGGIRDDEISVEVRPERLREYDVTFEEVAAAIRTTNLDVSGGQLKGSRSTIAIRTLGEQTRGIDLEGIVVRTQLDGTKVYVRDVAVIRDHFIDSDAESYFNGERAVNILVYKVGAQDVLQISETVKAYVAGKQRQAADFSGWTAAWNAPWYWRPMSLLGNGAWRLVVLAGGKPDPQKIYLDSYRTPFAHNYQVALHTDLARYLEGRLDLMVRNGAQGLVLVILSLMLFLNWRLAFWTSVGIPTAFLGSFYVMWLFGVSINLISLFGMIIVLGIIVDDAIVIGENIYRHIQEGMPPVQAAITGAEEVMWPVIAAVTTTIGAFLPLMFMEGQIGVFFGQLPLVIVAALSMSLVEALVILPAHLKHLPDQQHMAASEAKWMSRATDWLSHSTAVRAYEWVLRKALEWRYVTVATALSFLFVAAGLVLGGIVEWQFIQKMDAESLIADLEMPVGTPADVTRQRLFALLQAARELRRRGGVGRRGLACGAAHHRAARGRRARTERTADQRGDSHGTAQGVRTVAGGELGGLDRAVRRTGGQGRGDRRQRPPV
jgi:hydrophobic/amphiphilic exporter-1 (mainly G- bacteria), HAE1 family